MPLILTPKYHLRTVAHSNSLILVRIYIYSKIYSSSELFDGKLVQLSSRSPIEACGTVGEKYFKGLCGPGTGEGDALYLARF